MAPRTLVLGLAVVGVLSAPTAAESDRFPEPRPTTPSEAIDLLCPDSESRGSCLRAQLGAVGPSDLGRASGVRRATELLSAGGAFETGRENPGPAGLVIRDTTEVHSGSALGDGPDRSPDPMETASEGVRQARALLVGQLELPNPRLAELVIAELGEGVDGFFVPPRGRMGPGKIVLDATPADGPDGLRRAAIRQYAYATAVGMNYGLPPGWAEAFATWTAITIDGVAARDARVLSDRLRRLDAGLLAPAPKQAAGNALWFAFIEQAYGRAAVRSTVEELSGAQPVALALDRALRLSAGQNLGTAFREFHLWCVLTGERADPNHFSFARELDFPGFVTEARGLPALSVHQESPIGVLGATQILLRPQEPTGGMRVHFEGDLSADWSVDLLLVNDLGVKHRVPVSLSPERRGEVIVPLDHFREAWLLVRNVGSDDGASHRYTYFANYESGFPFETNELRAYREPSSRTAVVVAWNTTIEQDLVGFNILRRVGGGETEQTINPVWIPALGGFEDETSYRFVDRSAEPGVNYVYRIQGITTSGLSSYTETVEIGPSKRNN